MASLRRKTYERPVPDDAERVTRKGKPHARFRGDGKLITAPVTADGQRVRLQRSRWTIRYMDETGRQREVVAYTDKRASERKAAELEREAESIRSGEKTRAAIDHAGRPLVDHLPAFEREVSRGNTTAYVAATMQRVRAVIDGCDFRTAADIDAEHLAEWLDTLVAGTAAEAGPTGTVGTQREAAAAFGVSTAAVAKWRERGCPMTRPYDLAVIHAWRSVRPGGLKRGRLSEASAAHYLRRFKQFSRWLHRTERATADSLAAVPVPGETEPNRTVPESSGTGTGGADTADRRHRRRWPAIGTDRSAAIGTLPGCRLHRLATQRTGEPDRRVL